ncbi:MAG TPA: hypothetical protein VLL82_14945 [Mycobacterium sp.]|nr:hypothetical protein [Mycobacterium sp.]
MSEIVFFDGTDDEHTADLDDHLRTAIPTFTVAYREGENTIVDILATQAQATARLDQLTADGVYAVIGRHHIWLRSASECRYGRTARKTRVGSQVQSSVARPVSKTSPGSPSANAAAPIWLQRR